MNQAGPPRQTPHRPALLTAALVLVVADAAVSVVRSVLFLTSDPSIRQQVYLSTRLWGPIAQDPRVLAMITHRFEGTIWVSLIVTVVAYGGLLRPLPAGRAWARVAFSALAVLNLCPLAFLSYTGNASEWLLMIAVPALGIVTAALLWLPGVTRYMRAMRITRRRRSAGHFERLLHGELA